MGCAPSNAVTGLICPVLELSGARGLGFVPTLHLLAYALCLGGHSHQQLRGRSLMHQLSWTRAAQRLCEELASSLAAFCERGKLRIGACSKCQGERVGEASNPGPPRAATGASRDVADLLSAQLCEPSALGVRWLRGEFGRALSLSLSFARCTGFETVWLGVL